MSYTNQKVSWEPCDPNKVPINALLLDNSHVNLESDDGDQLEENVDIYGDDIMDIYGDIRRPQAIEVLVRKQPHENVINTSDGRTLLTKSIFYADPRVEPNAMKIAKMDKLDGETIVQIYVMCDRYNKPKMVRFITV